MNTTSSGRVCQRWDEQFPHPHTRTEENYPAAGLEGGHNYCRNPDGDVRAWCYTTDPGVRYEYCDTVPFCFPPAERCNSHDSLEDEELRESCAYSLCVADSSGPDEFGTSSIATTRAEATLDCLCPFETWDCKFGTKDCQTDAVRKHANECCVSKVDDPDWAAKDASCECLVKPGCDGDDGDMQKCMDYALHCCPDEECECEYRTRACRLALAMESDFQVESDLAREYCDLAVQTCCGVDARDVGGCGCDFYEPLCIDFPNHEADTCRAAASRCCGSDNDHCKCDSLTHAITTLGLEDDASECARASELTPDVSIERDSLKSIFHNSGGDFWLNNLFWTTAVDHCVWHGVHCDENGHVIRLDLRSNNVTGEFPADLLSKLYSLQSLDLADNSLRGALSGSSFSEMWGEMVQDSSIFSNLRALRHVDLSNNSLSGQVDVLFAPALDYANFSHNKLTSINSFKSFKPSHKTLRICDVSSNLIDQRASDILTNVPPNIEQLSLDNNAIHGTLPFKEENLGSLIKFSMASNLLSGSLPDFSSSFRRLQVLDLTNQKWGGNDGLTGPIRESLANLPFLRVLRLGGNRLTGSVPGVLGSIPLLKVLDIFDNSLSGSIPPDLGMLAGERCNSYKFKVGYRPSFKTRSKLAIVRSSVIHLLLRVHNIPCA